MNKAFVREADDNESDDEPGGTAPALPVGAPNYITPQGHARLAAELDHLLRVERPQVVEVVAWAASNGDRSENGDYIYGKKRLREIDRRIRFLIKRLDAAQVVDPQAQTQVDRVFFGATVDFSDAQGDVQQVTIVGIDETDTSLARISWVSPLARALTGARVGDTVRFQSPGGWREIEIEAVVYAGMDTLESTAEQGMEP